MQFARVIGNVTATHKDPKIKGTKLLVVQPVSLEFNPIGSPLVAVDSVGAGEGELVLIAAGSSARQTHLTERTPCDCVIMAIVDQIERQGELIFEKAKDE